MTTQEAIELAKKKLGKEITEQEAQDYINGKAALPDEALDVVSGGGDCLADKCYKCGSTNVTSEYIQGDVDRYLTCHDCGNHWAVAE